MWDFKARTGSMRRCFVVAPSAHKAELIGLHLIQASRDTVTVRGWHSGSEHFVELQEVPTMAASHRGSFGNAHRELVVLVFESRTLVLGCASLSEAGTDWFRGWRTVLSSCRGSVFAPHTQILLHVLYVVFII